MGDGTAVTVAALFLWWGGFARFLFLDKTPSFCPLKDHNNAAGRVVARFARRLSAPRKVENVGCGCVVCGCVFWVGGEFPFGRLFSGKSCSGSAPG